MIEVTGYDTETSYYLKPEMISSMHQETKRRKTYTLIYMHDDFKGVNGAKIYKVAEEPTEILLQIIMWDDHGSL